MDVIAYVVVKSVYNCERDGIERQGVLEGGGYQSPLLLIAVKMIYLNCLLKSCNYMG